jgi:hypothetical protein
METTEPSVSTRLAEMQREIGLRQFEQAALKATVQAIRSDKDRMRSGDDDDGSGSSSDSDSSVDGDREEESAGEGGAESSEDSEPARKVVDLTSEDGNGSDDEPMESAVDQVTPFNFEQMVAAVDEIIRDARQWHLETVQEETSVQIYVHERLKELQEKQMLRCIREAGYRLHDVRGERDPTKNNHVSRALRSI